MGWYGAFLVPKLKLCFYLRSVDEGVLESIFGSLDGFFGKYEKIKEDIEFVLETAEESRNFSAKATAKMFGIIDEIGQMPEAPNSVFLLYSLHKFKFEINYNSEDAVDLGKLRAKGWQIIE
ncbi:MAG: hypothetical protein V1676_02485 [Candidatus Diapherotrites archaeon]